MPERTCSLLIFKGLYDFIEVYFPMLTPEQRIIEQLESEIKRLNLKVDDLKEELRISKKMLEDITGEMQNTHPNQGE